MKNMQADRVTLAAFLLTVLIAGCNSLGVRFTVEELPPFWGAVLRFVPAALIMAGIALARRLPMPRGRNLLGAVLYGLVSFGASYFFLYWGLQKVQAGTAAIVLALAPLFTLLLAALQHLERFRWRAMIGALLALAGVAVVYEGRSFGNAPLPYMLAVVMGAACLAEGNLLIKRYRLSDPITTNVIGMAVGSLALFGASLLFREGHTLPARPSTWAALGYLILLGSCAFFVLNIFVLKRMPASLFSYTFVLMPFISISASAWLDNERLSPALFIGAVLVMTGVYFGVVRTQQVRVVQGSAAD
jgi:drug/metabolite transporter (DMT)-like permease